MRTFSNAAGSALLYSRLVASIRRGATLNESEASQTPNDGAILTATEAAERIRLILSCGF